MAALDIGHILFVEILKMNMYPGSPFTGNIIYDLVMFFFIPTIFIILVVWTIMGRLMEGGPNSLRLLIGIGLYIFIVFRGLYATFAYLVGPYFYFLIFIYGLLFYFIGHFGIVQSPQDLVEVRPRTTSMPAKGLRGGNAAADIAAQIHHLNRQIEKDEKRLEHAGPEERARVGAELAVSRRELAKLESELSSLEAGMYLKPGEQWWYGEQKRRRKVR